MFISELVEGVEPVREFLGLFKKPDDRLTLSKLQTMAPTILQLQNQDKNHRAVKYANSRKFTLAIKKSVFYAGRIRDWAQANLSPYVKVPNLPPNDPFIMLPYADKDGVISILKCRNINPNGRFRYIELIINKNAPKIYNRNKLDPNKTIYVLEGEIDASFIPNAIAMAGGGDITTNLSALPYPKQQYVIVYDNELDKQSTVTKIIKAIKDQYKVCIWPESVIEFKDVNDMIKSGLTPSDIRKIINKNTFVGQEAIAVLKKREVKVDTGDIWVNETTSKEVVKNRPLPWVDKFLVKLYPLKNELNPKFWGNNDRLKPDVQNTMLNWANTFIRSMRINPARVVDIQFKGSLANYVYHDESDVDVHVILDQKPSNAEMATILERQRKAFNDLNHFTLFGYPVEFFIRVAGDIHSSDAVYSLRDGKWIRKPNPPRDLDINEIKKFFVPWYNTIHDTYDVTWSKTKDKEKAWLAANREWQKIQDTRNRVLDGSPGAEYKPENLAFKAIKRTKFFKYLETERRRIEKSKQTL